MLTAAEAIAQLNQIASLPVDQQYAALQSLAAQVDVSVPANRTALFYSGQFRDLRSGVIGADEVAAWIAGENPGTFVRIDDTQLGEFLSSPELKNALLHASGDDIDLRNARLFGDADNSLFALASERFASGVSGKVVTITGNADIGRIFGRRELDALLQNSAVTEINGVPKAAIVAINDPDARFVSVRNVSEGISYELRIGRGSGELYNGVYGRVSAQWGQNVGLPEVGAFDTTYGRFTDNAGLKALSDPGFAARAARTAELLGPTVRFVGVFGTMLAVLAGAANAEELYRSGDRVGAVREIAGLTANLAVGTITAEAVGTMALPLLALGPVGWVAYGVLVLGSSYVAGQGAEWLADGLVDQFAGPGQRSGVPAFIPWTPPTTSFGTTSNIMGQLAINNAQHPTLIDAAVLSEIGRPSTVSSPEGPLHVDIYDGFNARLRLPAGGRYVVGRWDDDLGGYNAQAVVTDTWTGEEVHALIRLDATGQPYLDAHGDAELVGFYRIEGSDVRFDWVSNPGIDPPQPLDDGTGNNGGGTNTSGNAVTDFMASIFGSSSVVHTTSPAAAQGLVDALTGNAVAMVNGQSVPFSSLINGLTPSQVANALGISDAASTSQIHIDDLWEAYQRYRNMGLLDPPTTPYAPTPLERLATQIRLGFNAAFKFDISTLMASVGQVASRYLGISDPIAQVVVSSALTTAMRDFGNALAGSGADGAPAAQGASGPTAFADQISGGFWNTLKGQSIGAVSSYLTSELLAAAGVEGDALDFGVSTGGAAISQILSNLTGSQVWALPDIDGTMHIVRDAGGNAVPVSAPRPLGAQAMDRPWNLDLNVAIASAAASYFGGKLADSIIQFDTVGGQIGAAIGQTYGSYNAAAFLMAAGPSPINIAIAIIAVAVWKIIGGLIGSLFGGTPKAGAAVEWNEATQTFTVGHAWSKNGGSKGSVKAIAGQVGDLLNGVLAATGSRVIDAAGVQSGDVDQKGDRFIYKASASGSYLYSSHDPQKIITQAAFIALSDLSTRLAGGDVYAKRALSASLSQSTGNRAANGFAAGDFDIRALAGNLATARDYEFYLANRDTIDAVIGAKSDSAFALGWDITFARIIELGLDRRWASDWTGGWSVFLDQASDGAVDGGAFSPSAVSVRFDAVSDDRYFVFSDERGNILGWLGDTIDSAAKVRVGGTSGNDSIVLGYGSWTESVTTSQTVTDPETGTSSEQSTTRDVTQNGWRIANAAGLTIDGSVVASGPSLQVRVAATIDAGAGNDTINGGDLGNDLLGGDGDDTLIGGKLDDWEFGGAGNDKLFAGNSNPNALEKDIVGVDGGNGDYLNGGAGNDIIYGGKGSDWLVGGDGVDRIVGGDGGDIIDGGAGNDQGANGAAALLGGAGSDQYIFNRGSGVDVIYDDSDPSEAVDTNLNGMRTRYLDMYANPGARNWAGGGDYTADGSVVGGEDAISFGAGIGFENLKLTRSVVGGVATSDLIIEIVDDVNGALVATGDKLVIKDWFDDKRKIEWFRFADGQDVRVGDITSFIIGTAGQSSIVGTNGSDWVVGNDLDNDMPLLDGNDFGFGGKGDDLVAGDNNNDWVSGGDDDDQVMGGAGNDTVFGDAGDDHVSGNDGDDILSGGRGNDVVSGGAGNDLYKFWRGDGHDTVFDGYNLTTVVVSTQNGFTEQPNGDIIDADGRYIKRSGKWLSLMQYDAETHQYIMLEDPTTTTTTTVNQGTDTLEFGFGIDIEDVQLRHVAGGANLDLAIMQSERDASAFDAMSDGMTLQDWYSASAPSQIENFVFTEIGNLNVSQMYLGADVTDGDDANVIGHDDAAKGDWITGGLGDDAISGLAGADILSGNFGADHLDGGAGSDVLYGGADNDVLVGGAGADKMFGGAGEDIASYATSSSNGIKVSLANPFFGTGDAVGDAFSGVEGLEGTSGNDELWGDIGDNTLQGGAGNDTLRGDLGDDTYEINANQGNDLIFDTGITLTQIIDANGNLVSGYTAHWAPVEQSEDFNHYWIEYQLTVTDASGGIVYQSNEFSDFIYGTMGNHPMPSSSDWPTYWGEWQGDVRYNGLQAMMVDNTGADAGDDTIALGDDISLANITASWVNYGYDLKLAFSQGGSVEIQGQGYRNANNQIDPARQVEELDLADGLSLNLLNVKLHGDAGTNLNDSFFGAGLDDVFDGGDGNDVISGGAGLDHLSGGAGDDVLEGGAGDGAGHGDVFDGGSDSVTENHAAIAGNATAAYGDTIRYVTSASGVTIDLASGAMSGGDAQGDSIVSSSSTSFVSSIENITGSNKAADVLKGDDRANRLQGLAGDDDLEGRGGDDVLGGGAGNDTLVGGDGEDNIAGDDGNDAIDGGAGKDLIDGGAGDDTIHAGTGDDTIVGGAGVDTIYGGDDNDQISGGDDADTLYGEDGTDVLSGGAGDDIIYGGAGKDAISGDAGNDSLQGGDGDDAYVFDGASGQDTIIDAVGFNTIAFTKVTTDQLWLTQSGNDLKIGIIGGDTTVTISNYYATSGATLMNMIMVGDKTLYLAGAADLISAMTAASLTTPAAVPASVASIVPDYWGQAPQVSDQALNGTEDTILTGSVGAVDPDGQTLSYALGQGPTHGGLTLDAGTGAWSYTPNPNWNGSESFDINVTDADGQMVVQHVTISVAPANDAPVISSSAFAVNENAANGTSVGSLASTDVEGDAVTYSSTDAGPFAVSASGAITVANGALLNFEGNASYTIHVTALDAGGASSTKAITISLNDVNEKPTAIAFTNATNSLAENTSTASRIKVADLNITDDALGTNTLALIGADAASFEIFNGALYLKPGVSLNYEAKSSYSVQITVDDTAFSGIELTSSTFTLGMSDVNEAPSALALVNVTSTLPETTSTASRVFLADLLVTDDALGTNTLGVTGADAASFEILNGKLYLKAGVALNSTIKSSYAISVIVDDATLGSGPEQTQSFTLNVAALSLSLDNQTTSLAENTSTASPVKVADLNVADGVGTPTLSLSGADASFFEIYNGGLYVKAGVVLNYEAKSSYAVTVSLDEASVGSGVDITRNFTLTLTDVNEAPTAINFSNITTSLAENTSTANRIKVADLSIVDDALGTNTIGLTGADAASFEIYNGALYLKAGVTLNYEAKSSYSVTVTADDPGVGSSPDVTHVFNLSITDVNEAPTALNFANTTTSLVENTSTASRIKMADLVITDDALGANTISLSGADAASFEIYSGALYLKAGVTLNYEAKSSYAVTVNVDDANVGTSPDQSRAFTLTLSDVNEAPSAVSFANTTTTINESAIASDTKVADIVVADDALGTNGLTLSGADAASFKLIGSALYLKAGITLNYETKTSYSVTVSTDDTTVGATPDASQSFTLNVGDVNETPTLNWAGASVQTSGVSWNSGTLSLSVAENTAANVAVLRLATTDPDTAAANRDFRYELTGANASLFTVNATTGDIALAAPINYEAATHSWSVGVRVWDGGAINAGNSATGTITIAATNIDEAPTGSASGSFWTTSKPGGTQIGTVTATDPEAATVSFSILSVTRDVTIDGDTTTNSIATSNYSVTTGGAVKTVGTQGTGLLNKVHDEIQVRASDQTGHSTDFWVNVTYDKSNNGGGGGGQTPPVVFDLNGDGINLVARAASNIVFDVNGDGAGVHTGWVAGDDGMLALDRNGDGVIGSGAEISFAQDVEGAQSDLQGLRAYDTNKNGFFDAGDAQFAQFQIWQDANQDGVSQAGELKSLTGWNIAAVNLTGTSTGQSITGATDNVVRATGDFVRSDGSLGQIGDVYLSYDAPSGATINPAQPTGPGTDADQVNRQASNSGRKIHHPFNVKLAQKHNSDGLDWIFNHGEGVDAAQSWRSGAHDWLKDHLDQQSKRKHSIFDDVRNSIFSKLGHGSSGDDDDLIQDNGPMPPVASALHQGLGVADKRVLNMIDAMASFGVKDGGDFNASSMRDPRVAQLLTTVADFRHGQTHPR